VIPSKTRTRTSWNRSSRCFPRMSARNSAGKNWTERAERRVSPFCALPISRLRFIKHVQEYCHTQPNQDERTAAGEAARAARSPHANTPLARRTRSPGRDSRDSSMPTALARSSIPTARAPARLSDERPHCASGRVGRGRGRRSRGRSIREVSNCVRRETAARCASWAGPRAAGPSLVGSFPRWLAHRVVASCTQ